MILVLHQNDLVLSILVDFILAVTFESHLLMSPILKARNILT